MEKQNPLTAKDEIKQIIIDQQNGLKRASLITTIATIVIAFST